MKRWILLLSVLGACDAAAEPLRLAAMTSLIASAARDVAGEQVQLVDVLPPGGCPGHFDLTPAQARDLRNADVWIRHDYQAQLTLPWGVEGEMKMIASPGSFLIPANYGTLATGVGNILAAERPSLKPLVEQRLQALKIDLNQRTANWREVAGRWKGTRVIASLRQREFCAWLGFEVVAVLPPGESIAPRDWSRLMQVDADLVVANLQSDAAAGQALARQIERPVVVLSNFPGAPGFGQSYGDLCETNRKRLDDALATH